jgi:hypothetical protein
MTLKTLILQFAIDTFDKELETDTVPLIVWPLQSRDTLLPEIVKHVDD